MIRAFIFIIAFVIYTALLAKLLTLYSVVASIAYCLLLYGFAIRKIDRIWHARIMRTAMLLDVTLVLILEIQRHAVEKALEFSMTMLQQLHIGFSTLALVLYLPTFLLGRKLLQSPAPAEHARLRFLHIRVAILALIFRSLGFLLMFSILLGRKN